MSFTRSIVWLNTKPCVAASRAATPGMALSSSCSDMGSFFVGELEISKLGRFARRSMCAICRIFGVLGRRLLLQRQQPQQYGERDVRAGELPRDRATQSFEHPRPVDAAARIDRVDE